MSAGHTLNAGEKNLIKFLVLRSVCRVAPALPAFSSLCVTDKWQNTKDGRLILADFLLVSTVARVDVLCGAVAWSFTQGLRDQQYSQIIIFGWWIKSGWKTWVLDICRESATQSQEKDPKPQGVSRGMAYIEERLSGATRHRWNTSGQKGGKKNCFPISKCTEDYFKMWCFFNCSILFDLSSDWDTCRLCDITYFLFSCSWNQTVFQLSQPPLFSDTDEHSSQRWKNKNVIHFHPPQFRRLSPPSKEQETNNHLLRGESERDGAERRLQAAWTRWNAFHWGRFVLIL